MEELVSVIIPCYNASGTIERCVRSLFDSDHQNIEYILVNDGSKDDTLTKLNLLQTQNQGRRITILTQENTGLSGARNAGISAARGKYILFVDADDWVVPQYIDWLLSKASKRALVACSYTRAFGEKLSPRSLGLAGECSSRTFKIRLFGLTGEELRDPSNADSMNPACMKLYLADIIRSNDLQFVHTSEVGSEDLLFNLEYANQLNETDKIYVIDEPLYIYFKTNTSSLSQKFNPHLFDQWLNLFKRMEMYIRSEREMEALNNRIILSIIGLCLNELERHAGAASFKKSLSPILNHPIYVKAFQTMDTREMPIHWKIFFHAVHRKWYLAVYLLTKGIRLMIGK